MSIFDEGNKVTSNYWKYPNVGDKVEGTYTDKRVTTNRLKPGEDQIVYTLKQEDDSFIDVYGKPAIDAQMRNIKIGQIIGFQFTEEKESKVPGYNNTKVVQVFANPDVMDNEWLENKEFDNVVRKEEEIDSDGPNVPETTTDGKVENGTFFKKDEVKSKTADIEAVMAEINTLAKEKLGAETPEDVKMKTMEATGLAFIEGNLPQILTALKAIK